MSDDEEERVDDDAMEWLVSLGLGDYASNFVSNYGLKSREDFEDYGCQCDLDEMGMPRAQQRAYLRALGEFDSDDDAYDDSDDDSDTGDSMDSETSQRYGEYLAAVEDNLDEVLGELEGANEQFRDGLTSTGFDTASPKLEDNVRLPFLREEFENQATLEEGLVINIIKTATELLRAEPNMVHLHARPGVTINVVGDIHGCLLYTSDAADE